ncbi:PREDICTED: cyclin N-terminal domain-containing protein 1 isoform X2 [Gavialis gangeticus]|uniref:cyclin N-terminal domain-containing protein 1 isoform X2 n=1 Tax=Gavialis gangeticus TaxID=94835 RepID=UPI00092EC7D3|nr:PREDICTED: cyclin N-terminal domain-containing protein 1 isoform X2 [Gavialis gangeticus]XP_019361190.1 PREDICTED: cyclin N-terminal domain-containing protein 1 isoform X2 [Gavialis gangeticus]
MRQNVSKREREEGAQQLGDPRHVTRRRAEEGGVVAAPRAVGMARAGPARAPCAFGRLLGPAFGAAAPELLEAALLRLAADNERRLRDLPAAAGCFREPRATELIFLLAEKWRLDPPARYQAAEIFDRFMIKQVQEMYNSTKESGESSEQGYSHSWNSLKAQMHNTFMLRLASCIQLASKLSFHYSIVNNNMVLKFLQSLDYSFTKQELLESELAVLKGLHFQINVPTPLAYVELLLEVLGHNGCLLSLKQLHEMCVHLLDLTYLMRDVIYNTLLKTSIENSTPNELQIAKFLSVKEDFMLLAAGIIGTSAFILNPEHWNQVVEHLNCITGITSQSMFEFLYAILKHSLGTTPTGTNARQME